MKIIIRIPTVQYGYIELDMGEVEGTPENIIKVIKTHNNAIEAYNTLAKADIKTDIKNNDDF